MYNMPMNLDDFHMLNVSQKKHLFECKVKELNCTTQNSQKFTRNNSFNLNSNVKNSVKIKKLQKSNTVKYQNRKTKIFENNFSLFDCSVDVAKTSNITKKNSQSSTIDFNFLDCNKTRTFHDIPENTNEYEDSVYHLDNENMNTHEINRYSFINSSFTGSNKNKGGISTCSTISCNADNYDTLIYTNLKNKTNDLTQEYTYCNKNEDENKISEAETENRLNKKIATILKRSKTDDINSNVKYVDIENLKNVNIIKKSTGRPLMGTHFIGKNKKTTDYPTENLKGYNPRIFALVEDTNNMKLVHINDRVKKCEIVKPLVQQKNTDDNDSVSPFHTLNITRNKLNCLLSNDKYIKIVNLSKNDYRMQRRRQNAQKGLIPNFEVNQNVKTDCKPFTQHDSRKLRHNRFFTETNDKPNYQENSINASKLHHFSNHDDHSVTQEELNFAINKCKTILIRDNSKNTLTKDNQYAYNPNLIPKEYYNSFIDIYNKKTPIDIESDYGYTEKEKRNKQKPLQVIANLFNKENKNKNYKKTDNFTISTKDSQVYLNTMQSVNNYKTQDMPTLSKMKQNLCEVSSRDVCSRSQHIEYYHEDTSMTSRLMRWKNKAKRKILKKNVSNIQIPAFTKKMLNNPITPNLSKKEKKNSLVIFKMIQMFMDDRNKTNISQVDILHEIISCCWKHNSLKNEFYMQLIAQTTGNDYVESLVKGWELMSLTLCFIEPNDEYEKILHDHISKFTSEPFQSMKNLQFMRNFNIDKLAEICLNRLNKNYSLYSRPLISPSYNEIELAIKSLKSNSLFGNSLEELMKMQKDKYPNLKVPWIMIAMIDLIFSLNGSNIEGIFRISSAINVLSSNLRYAFENYEIPNSMEKFSAIDVAALFKNWLKILPKALISSELYDMFYDDSSVIIRSDTCIIAKINKITEEMNPLYSYVLRFLVKFIKKMCLQDIMAKTKMNKLNYSIVLSPNIFQSHKMVRNSDNIFRTTNQINMFNSLIAHCDVSDIEWPVIKYNISNHL